MSSHTQSKPKKTRALKASSSKKKAQKTVPVKPPKSEVPKVPEGRPLRAPPIKRILKKAGCLRISMDVDPVVYALIRQQAKRVLIAAKITTEHAARKTILISDLGSGFQVNGQYLALSTTVKKSTKKLPPTGEKEKTPAVKHKKRSPSATEIPFQNFRELCKEILAEEDPNVDFRFSKPVISAFQYSIEAYVVELGRQAVKCALHDGRRKTVKGSDFTLVYQIRGW